MDKIRVAHYKVLTQKCLTDYYELVCAYHAGFCCSIFYQYHSDDDETSPHFMSDTVLQPDCMN